MAKRNNSVLLVTYTNDSGDRMEWVLPKAPAAEVALIEAFLLDYYPDGEALVSVVCIEAMSDFTEGFAGEFEAFLAGAWTR